MAVREDPLFRVVVDDYLVGVRYSDDCVGAGVAWLEFVGAGKGADHDLLSNFEWGMGYNVLVFISRLRESNQFIFEHLGGGVGGYGWLELWPEWQHCRCPGE